MKHFFSLMRGWSAALLILLWLAGPAARAQAPAWQSVMALGANVQAVTTDAGGNVYVTGDFDGSITVGAVTLTSTRDETTFIAKWVPATNSFAWAQRIAGAVTSIATNGNSVYVAGYFGGTVTFGSTTLTNASGYSDGFVLKLIDLGSSVVFGWAQQVGGFHYEEISALAVSGTSVYIAGYFASYLATFGSISLVNSSNSGNAPRDVFVAKIADAGASSNFVWALKGGGQDFDQAKGLAVNGPNVYISGNFTSSTATFGAIQLFSAGDTDAFVAKITDAGASAAYTWALRAGGTSYDEATALAVSGANVYAVGRFYSNSAPFGPHVLTKSTTYSGDHDLFVTKLIDAGAAGSFAWAQRAGDSGGDIGDAVAVSGSNIYVSGRFTGVAVQFGSIVLNAPPNGGHWNIFVCKLTDAGSTGAFAWAQQAWGPLNDYGYALAISGSTVYVGGSVELQGTFGSFIINAGYFNGFLAALTDPTLTATATAQGNLPFTLAPNPARASTTVLLPAVPGAATATLTLRDALGRVVRTASVALPAAGLRHEVDLTNLPAGLYALQVRAGAATTTRRLVVE